MCAVTSVRSECVALRVLTESLRVTITNDCCLSGQRPAVAVNAAAEGPRPGTTGREAANDGGLQSDGRPITLTRTQRRRQQRRRTDRQVAVITDGRRTRERTAPGAFSLPIRIDRDTMMAPSTIRIRVLDGFLNIFEVPSASYHWAMQQTTRVQDLRPAGMSDSEDDADACIERSLAVQNYCTMCGAETEEYCCECNALRNRLPDLS